MYYYSIDNKILFSKHKYDYLEKKDEIIAKNYDGILYYLVKLPVGRSRKSFCISDASLLNVNKEDIELLKYNNHNIDIPQWLKSKINSRQVIALNTSYDNWQDMLNREFLKEKWKINILALGDVGGMLLTGLRLMGSKHIDSIGIYDRNPDKVKRWEYEMNQILPPFSKDSYPDVKGISYDELFDCDMFVFCASRGVPPVGSNIKDVRMAQLESNSKIIKEYAKLARDKNFKGIFAVVSDPVDLLCKVVFNESNKDLNGNLDYKGLAPEQIRGYGLGVMNARACYYAKQSKKTSHFLNEGRVFGPHGKDLIVADSIKNYNEEISEYLTQKTITANLEVRKTGFKPYIAPALSSGSLSILYTISGQWHYSSTFLGGVYMGAKNRLTHSGTELERLVLPSSLYEKIKLTYKRLGEII